jgi:hypothetical protein
MDDDYDGYLPVEWQGAPKRRRCFACDRLDWHDSYVQVLTPAGRWIETFPVCDDCLPAVKASPNLPTKRGRVKRYNRPDYMRRRIAEARAKVKR